MRCAPITRMGRFITMKQRVSSGVIREQGRYMCLNVLTVGRRDKRMPMIKCVDCETRRLDDKEGRRMCGHCGGMGKVWEPKTGRGSRDGLDLRHVSAPVGQTIARWTYRRLSNVPVSTFSTTVTANTPFWYSESIVRGGNSSNNNGG